MSTRILLIDPDVAHADWLGRATTPLHWETVTVDTAAEAMDALGQSFDCIVTELNLPDHPGDLIWIDELTRHKSTMTPLLVSSVLDDLQTRVLALKLGADALLPKPFEADLFVARVEALVRNAQAQIEAMVPRMYELLPSPPSPPPVIVGPLKIHRFEAWIDGELLALTPIEFRLLHALAKGYPESVARSDLIIATWGDSATEETNRKALWSHKSRLDETLRPRFRVVAVRGRNSGYRLEYQPELSSP